MVKHVRVLTCLGFLVCAPLRAQVGTRDSLARDIVSVTHAVASMQRSVSAWVDYADADQQQVLRGLQQALHAFAEKYVTQNVVVPRLAAAYENAYSESELAELLSFFRSDVGNRYIALQQELPADIAKIATDARKDHAVEYEMLLQQVLRGNLPDTGQVPRVRAKLTSVRDSVAREFVDFYRANQPVPRTGAVTLDSLRRTMPGPASAQLEAARIFQQRYYPPDVVWDATAHRYAQEFSEQELRSLLQVFHAPIGRAYMAKDISIQETRSAIVQAIMTEHKPEYDAIMIRALSRDP